MTVEEIRRSLNLSQQEFANRLGISKRAYSNKVMGHTDWLVRELAKIAEYGEITIPSGDQVLVIKASK